MEIQATNTKIRIAKALEEILEVTDFSAITVINIMKKCGMSRLTFYNHFIDIDDLVSWMNHLYTNEATKLFYQTKNFKESFRQSMNVMAQHKAFYKYAVTLHGPNSYNQYHFEKLKKEAITHIGSENIDDEIMFSLNLYWNGAVGALTEWIKNDMKITPSVMAGYLYNSLPANIIRFYD